VCTALACTAERCLVFVLSLPVLPAVTNDAWRCPDEAMHDLEQLLTGRAEPIPVDSAVMNE